MSAMRLAAMLIAVDSLGQLKPSFLFKEECFVQIVMVFHDFVIFSACCRDGLPRFGITL
jgi:hypothetical protein